MPVCRQQIKGWPTATHKEAQIESTVLNTLKIAKEINVFLTDLTPMSLSDPDVVIVSADPLTTYQLRIRYTNENRDVTINFDPSKTILDIKNDCFALFKVPVRHQIWTGWPEQSSNTTKLSETGFNGVHSLQLTRMDVENNFNRDV